MSSELKDFSEYLKDMGYTKFDIENMHDDRLTSLYSQFLYTEDNTIENSDDENSSVDEEYSDDNYNYEDDYSDENEYDD